MPRKKKPTLHFTPKPSIAALIDPTTAWPSLFRALASERAIEMCLQGPDIGCYVLKADFGRFSPGAVVVNADGSLTEASWEMMCYSHVAQLPTLSPLENALIAIGSWDSPHFAPDLTQDLKEMTSQLPSAGESAQEKLAGVAAISLSCAEISMAQECIQTGEEPKSASLPNHAPIIRDIWIRRTVRLLQAGDELSEIVRNAYCEYLRRMGYGEREMRAV
jgi:hypothetical protein